MSKKPLSDEDRALFKEAVQDVRPLKQAPSKQETCAARAIPRPRPRTKSEDEEEALAFLAASVSLSHYYPEEVGPETVLSYQQAGFPKKQFLSLQKGLVPWERRLDLHGFKPDEAKDVLLKFIFKGFLNNVRTLLIIHGKGGRASEAPVLKNLIHHWLPQLPQVLAFHSALPKDGGNGALYVLLKRNREEI